MTSGGGGSHGGDGHSVLDRFPHEFLDGPGRAQIESGLNALDRLVVRDTSGKLLIDENVFRPALQPLSLSDQDIDALIAGSRELFTSDRGLPPVRLSELHAVEPKLKPPTDGELDQLSFRHGTDVQGLRAAFEHASHAHAATVDMSAAELRQQIRAALTAEAAAAETTAGVTWNQFVSCLYGELAFIIAWTLICALALWGVYAGWLGTIIFAGVAVSAAALWWLIVIAFGVGIAWITFHCLGWL